MIAALPIELRETLVLRELEELVLREIAEVTRTPIGTVMSAAAWRARRLLAQAARRGRGGMSAMPDCDKVLLVRPSSTASSARPRRRRWRRIAPNARSARLLPSKFAQARA